MAVGEAPVLLQQPLHRHKRSTTLATRQRHSLLFHGLLDLHLHLHLHLFLLMFLKNIMKDNFAAVVSLTFLIHFLFLEY